MRRRSFRQERAGKRSCRPSPYRIRRCRRTDRHATGRSRKRVDGPGLCQHRQGRTCRPERGDQCDHACDERHRMVQHLSVPGKKRFPRTGENERHDYPRRDTAQCRSGPLRIHRRYPDKRILSQRKTVRTDQIAGRLRNKGLDVFCTVPDALLQIFIILAVHDQTRCKECHKH